VLAKEPNRDWYKTVETTKIYYLKGNPLSLFDLERANFKLAKTILILQTASSQGLVDADGIFCVKMVEENLPQLSMTQVILELLQEDNYYMIPLHGGKNHSSMTKAQV